MSFGRNILIIRENNSLTGEQMAEKLKEFLPGRRLSKQSVSDWESKENPTSQEVVDAYHKAFGVGKQELVYGDLSRKGTSEVFSQELDDYKFSLKELHEMWRECRSDLKEKKAEIVQLKEELEKCRSTRSK